MSKGMVRRNFYLFTLLISARSFPTVGLWLQLLPHEKYRRSCQPPLGNHGCRRRCHQFSAVKRDESNDLESLVKTNRYEKDSNAVSKAALEKLRNRQREELEETERLLELLLAASEEDTDRKASSHPISPTYSSTAASILSGVDYGFTSRSEGPPVTLKGGLNNTLLSPLHRYQGPPANLWTLGTQQFMRNWKAIQGEYTDEPDSGHLTVEQIHLQKRLNELTLNSTEIWEREYANGAPQAPWIIKLPYLAICYMLDVVFEGRSVPSRFYLLETVARMPYFSYITMLHLYETLGFWRRSADMKRIHFAEELNEYRHLLIMESIGGDQEWWVRFVAQHSAVIYYIVLCILFAISPSLSYLFSEMLENHAVITYSVFCENNEALLKNLPPSKAAVEYYSLGTSDPFYAEFQTAALASGQEIRRPGVNMRNLHDVFLAIADDECDHVQTMAACLDPGANLRSPSLERRTLTGIALIATASFLLGTSGVVDPVLFSANDVGPDPAVLDAADVVVDMATTASDGITLAELTAAGLAAIGRAFAEDETARKAVEVVLEPEESGLALTSLEQIRGGVVKFFELLARILR